MCVSVHLNGDVRGWWMIEAGATKEPSGSGPVSSGSGLGTQGRWRTPRWLVWCGAVVVVLLVAGAAGVAYVAHNAEPMLRRRVVASLEQRFQSPVELDALHLSVLRGLQVSGEGLRILNMYGRGRPTAHSVEAVPMISVKSFTFHSGLLDLLKPTMRVNIVHVIGMQVHIPPKQQRGERVPMPPGKPHKDLVVNKIICSDMILTVETNKPGKLPLVFDIADVTLHDVGTKQPFVFEAWLVNPKPLGKIHSTGHFGPWAGDDPRDTPVDGSYSFTGADLDTIKGIGGILSSTGEYRGTLGEIGVTGTTDTPDFSLDVSNHPVHLQTQFDATVDGTSGDTRLNSVHATLRNTVLDVKGMVLRASHIQGDLHEKARNNWQGDMPEDNGTDAQGHYIDISVVSDQARVEDVLTLGAKTAPPLMQGALTLRAHLSIPPGQASVSQKIRIAGTFGIRGATFSNAKWQETVDKLSMRASGHPQQANAVDATRVTSQMGGNFALAGGTLDVTKLNYQMPGADVALAGKYSLDGKTFDFAGTVRTKATVSGMLTGWKKMLALPFDPLLKKNGAGLQVPIKISGTQAEPKFGVDMGKLKGQIFGRGKEQDQAVPKKQP